MNKKHVFMQGCKWLKSSCYIRMKEKKIKFHELF